MRLQPLKTGAPLKNSAEAVNTVFTKTVRTKDKIRKKTRGLWGAARQLKGLSDLLSGAGKEPYDKSDQYGPLIELNTGPADNLLELKTEVEASKSTNRNRKKTETDRVKPSGTKSVIANGKTAKRVSNRRKRQINPETKLNGDEATNGLSPRNEEADTKTDTAEALPDTSVREILNELEDIERLIRER